jgi:hypothetical protein
MIVHVRGWIIGVAGVALAVALLSGEWSSAADDKALQESVKKLAAAIEKKDTDGAKKLAEEIAKKDANEDVMALFAPRTKADGKIGRGLGVGDKPGAIKPDGIERKLMGLAEKDNLPPAKQLDDESQALTAMGYHMAALAMIAHASEPSDKDKKDVFKKRKKDWLTWADELRDASLQFAAAAKDKKASELHKAAAKADGACTKCHNVFRD